MAGRRVRRCLLRGADDADGPGAAVVRHRALRSARPVMPSDHPRDWSDGIEQGVAGLRVAVLRRPGFDAPVDADEIAAVQHAAMLSDIGERKSRRRSRRSRHARHIRARVGYGAQDTVSAMPTSNAACLIPTLLEVMAGESGLGAKDDLAAEAMRIAAGHVIARFRQRYDLILCPACSRRSPVRGRTDLNPREALWTRWAPWTFAFNLTRQPAITDPAGLCSGGLPRSAQIAAAQGVRDDLGSARRGLSSGPNRSYPSGRELRAAVIFV